MLTQLPFTTSEEIAAEFRPEKPGRVQSALRTLKSHKAVSDGVSQPLRRQTGGRLGGKLTLYSSLNLDAARCAREGDYKQAAKIARAAIEIELADQMQTLVQQLGATHTSIGKNALVSAVRDEQNTLAITKLLAQKTDRKRTSLKIGRPDGQRLFGRVAEMSDDVALVRIDGLTGDLAVHLDDLRHSGSLFVGAPLMLTWERWPGGKTLMTTDAALDLAAEQEGQQTTHEVGYPYVVPLPSRDAPALVLNTVAGMTPTMRAARRIHING